jgi:hypothetical protein
VFNPVGKLGPPLRHHGERRPDIRNHGNPHRLEALLGVLPVFGGRGHTDPSPHVV